MSKSKTDITIDAYDKNVGNYAKKFMEFKPYVRHITSFQRNYMHREAEVLDLGCGPGNNSKILLNYELSLKITGTDLSEKAIEMARENVPNASFLVQDIREISTEKKYDTVIAAFCIVHLSDSETITLIKKISDILHDDGTLYLSFMEGKMPGFETTSFSEDEIFFNYYNRNEIIQLLAEHGLATVQISTEEYKEENGTTTDDVFIFARNSLPKQ